MNSFFFKTQAISFKLLIKIIRIRLNYDTKTTNFVKYINNKSSLLRVSSNVCGPLKKKKNFVFTALRKLKLLKKYFRAIFLKKFYLKYINARNLNFFFKNFKNKSLYEIFGILTYFLPSFLNKIFPFFNKIYIYTLLKKNYIFLNFLPLKTFNIFLHPGDFLSFSILKQLLSRVSYWFLKQKYYLNILQKKLNLLKNKKKAPFLTTIIKKNNRNITLLKKNLPFFFANIEFDFFTFSLFVIHKKNISYSLLFNFNPFLFRLLNYK